jgi:hypothetical protein
MNLPSDKINSFLKRDFVLLLCQSVKRGQRTNTSLDGEKNVGNDEDDSVGD